jgi:RimJ/RimL family protein N-acetyltransferase
VDPSRYPIVILVEGDPVGFFVLHEGEGISTFTDNPNAILVRAFSINHKHQGKGYAKMAMLGLPNFVKKNFTTIEEIVLAVNAKNIAARGMYLKAGYIDKGIRREGSIGMQYLLHNDLN